MGGGDVGRTDAEHVEHGLGALGVHQAGGRKHRQRVLQRGEIGLLVGADEVVWHLRHDLLGAVRMDPAERGDYGVGQRLRLVGMGRHPFGPRAERAARIVAAEHRLGVLLGARVGEDGEVGVPCQQHGHCRVEGDRRVDLAALDRGNRATRRARCRPPKRPSASARPSAAGISGRNRSRSPARSPRRSCRQGP